MSTCVFETVNSLTSVVFVDFLEPHFFFFDFFELEPPFVFELDFSPFKALRACDSTKDAVEYRIRVSRLRFCVSGTNNLFSDALFLPNYACSYQRS